jgi:phosphate butyryltransferase
MKGNIHCDEVLKHVTMVDGGLRAGRRIRHVFVLDVPGREGPLLISDAAINIAPDLMTKADIIQNASDLARAIGLDEPLLGLLFAVETVNPAIPSTLDAAILSKMAERGQIKGGIVDGPLAMDNALDIEAAKTKGIAGMVAGHADVLVVPNLEAGNMLAKQLVFLSDADTGGLVVGAKAPVMLTSRADDEDARLMSAVLAVLYSHWRRTSQSLVSTLQV